MENAALTQELKIFFSVGEPSGDLHASGLIKALSASQYSGGRPVSFRGFGGPNMEKAGCQLDYELTNMAVLGFVEVLPKLRKFFQIADQASAVFEQDRPDAVVLVDFPGFNWHIAKRAKKHGIPVFYYLPPQLWAWASWRIRKLRANVDHVLCNLPFEADWYAERGLEVEYVGHPFFEEVSEKPLDADFLNQWSGHDGVQVAVLPGSRWREVREIWPMQLAAIRELGRRHPQTRFLVACLNEDHLQHCKQTLHSQDQRDLNVQFFSRKTSEIIELADCSLMKSGSVSLEMMARQTPCVVLYHASWTFYQIGRRLTSLNSMVLPNLIAGETLMPEFLAIGNRKAKVIDQAIDALGNLIANPQARDAQREKLTELNHKFGQSGASKRAASIILDRLGLPLREELPVRKAG